MDALSLSHLTYRFATGTIIFHRLDHPPFPCKKNVEDGAGCVKGLFEVGADEVDEFFADVGG